MGVLWAPVPSMACQPLPESAISDPEKLLKRASAAYLVIARRGELMSSVQSGAQNQHQSSLEMLLDVIKRGRVGNTGFERRGIFYEFDVMENILGPNLDAFSLMSAETAMEIRSENFAGHSASAFWRPLGGRSQIEGDCSVWPQFQIGKQYLIIVSEAPHVKAFERIDSAGDFWLSQVRSFAAGARNSVP